MLQFIKIRHQFGSNVLFDEFSWHIKPNRKIGLVGPNGAGKTTLFLFGFGAMRPDSGEIVKARETQISLFHQIPDFDPQVSVIETSLLSNLIYRKYHKQRLELEEKFDSTDIHSENYRILIQEQSELEDYAQTNDIHTIENKAKKILSGLGFKQSDFERPVSNFSPGYQHRLGLAIALLNPHNLLFLDEPTNHLDDGSKEWLIEYLESTKAGFVLVTHDPQFLNRTTDTIAEISTKGVLEFEGNLEEFLAEKNEIHEKIALQYKKEQAYVEKRMEWINRFRAQATKARQVQSAVKKLEKRDKISAPDEIFWNKKPEYQFEFAGSGKISFRLENASFRYDALSPFNFSGVDLEVSSGEKIALVGPNGAGKSTLFRCIRGEYTLNSGVLYLGPKTVLGYFSQTHREDLDPEKSVLEMFLKIYPELSEVSARTLLGHFSFTGDSVFKQIKNLSGGEQSRLRLSILVREPTNCLLLDEPTNHLDMVTRNALKSALLEYPGSVLLISHDPEFLSGLCNRTFELAGGILKDLNCDFKDFLLYHKEKSYEISINERKDKPKQDYQQRNQEKNKLKKIQKEIEVLETQITELESFCKKFEIQISDPEFYSSANYREKYLEYEASKKNIQELTRRWEELNFEVS